MYENNHQGVYSGYRPYHMPEQMPSEPEGNRPGNDRKKKGGFFKRAIAAITLGIFFGVSAGASFYTVKYVADQATPVEKAAPLTEESAPRQEEPESIAVIEPESDIAQVKQEKQESVVQATSASATSVMDVSSVVKEVMPAMVSITNTYVYTQQDFFGQSRQQEQQASGSGFIVGKSDTELLVVTNNHVVEDATTLYVQFIDGEEVEAQIKGTDSPKDLAVIAVQLKDIPKKTQDAITIVQLGDSDTLQVGEGAIAVGNALGYGQSVTTGVISAVDREIQMDGITGTFIQTDAAINPGNSGGALLNMKGQVIGINSNKIGGSVVEGMGYAIPISSARPIIEELMTKTTRIRVDEDKRGFLGISGVNVTDEAANDYNMPKGVMVAQVYQGTGAEAAGIVKGNIIVKFDGTSISTMEELQRMLEYYAAGTTVEVTVMEGSPKGWREKTVKVRLGRQ